MKWTSLMNGYWWMVHFDHFDGNQFSDKKRNDTDILGYIVNTLYWYNVLNVSTICKSLFS